MAVFALSSVMAFANVHHQLAVVLSPEEHALEVRDQLTLDVSSSERTLCFQLHKNLNVTSCNLPIEVLEGEQALAGAGWNVNGSAPDAVPTRVWKVLLPESRATSVVTLDLVYAGKIHHPIQQLAQEYARGFSETPGIIDPQGVFLCGASAWIPWFDQGLVTFDLNVTTPESWYAVSQGAFSADQVHGETRTVTWACPHSMEEIYLVAAPFQVYEDAAGPVKTLAYLRSPDDGLAAKYLETTAQYLDMYAKLIGPFPFSKFALVENFWETGYGMPSFTLLGEKVIRFPFILHSSYPHELLHNYWGNSVYVDFESGNWCEGLTVFMADQLIKEQRGQGADHRRSALQRFTDYVRPEIDFPLNQFRSRHDAASEAIGYGKCQMMFNMLLTEVGKENWIRAIRAFYETNRFKVASFSDIQQAFEATTQRDLGWFFHQWITRTGAPEFRLTDVAVQNLDEGFRLGFRVDQVQAEEPFRVTLPVAVWMTEGVHTQMIQIAERQQRFSIELPNPPVRLALDPEFDVFRRLHPREIPPALSKVFGADSVMMILPEKGDEALLSGYRRLAEKWAEDETRNWTVVRDADLDALPEDAAVWVFGRQNRFASTIKDGLQPHDATPGDDMLRIQATHLTWDDHSTVIAVRHPANPRRVVVGLTLETSEAVDGLARKLPHYGKYSVLAFQGPEPSNVFKHQWPTVGSPLLARVNETIQEADLQQPAALPERQPLIEMGPLFSEKALMKHVTFLASPELKGRGWGTPELDRAADYIADQFQRAGLSPWTEKGYFQEWTENGGPENHPTALKNVVAMIPGHHPQLKKDAVVIAAHYDHLGLGWPDVRAGNEGKIHPGADDNASGVAVLLELARELAQNAKPARTLIFAAFTAEEAGLVGSRHFVEEITASPRHAVASCINLDTVGRLGSGKIMVLGGSSAREWKFIFMGCSYTTGVDSVMVTQELDASDQMRFIAAGIPAVQLFIGPHEDYHRPSDTPDKVDAQGLVKVATFAREAIGYLAQREDPLTFTGQIRDDAPPKASHGTSSGRRVSTGIMPDFTFSGQGVRVGSVAPDSPADKAGLQVGDVILAVDGTEVADLRSYAQTLKDFQVGDSATFTTQRNGEARKATIVFGER